MLERPDAHSYILCLQCWGDVPHPSKQSRKKTIGSVTVPSSYLYIAVVKSIDAGPNLGMFP